MNCGLDGAVVVERNCRKEDALAAEMLSSLRLLTASP
jgi:hypothetical protein